MEKIGCVFLLMMLLNGSVTAQENDSKKNKFWVGLSPAALVDLFDGASYRLTAECRISNHYALAVEAGGYLQYMPIPKINPKGWLVKPSVKYYFNRKTGSDANKYLAIEYQYKKQDFDFKDSIALQNIRFEKQYGIRRKMNCLSVKYGAVSNYGSRFITEWFVGLGVRFSNTKFDLTEEEENGILDGEENGSSVAQNVIRVNGNQVQPNFLCGFKIGYRIR